MSDVKRYEPFGRDGLSSVMHEDSVGDYVRYDDHEDKRKGWIEQHARDSKELRELCQARDEARKERDQLSAEVQRLRSYEAEWEHVLNELRAELDQYKADPSYEAACATIRALRAELAAIRGQQSATALELRKASSWICREVEAGTTSATHWAIRLRDRAEQIEADTPQQPDAVSVPRELVQEALEMAIDDAEEHQCSPCFNPTRQRVLDAQVERWRALLSTRQAEEGE